jgi:hypothetical protein
MNQTLTKDGGPAPAAQADLRRDHRQREIVDHGVALQQHGGSIAAFEFLDARHVRRDVIQRVLLEPGRMRGAG